MSDPDRLDELGGLLQRAEDDGVRFALMALVLYSLERANAETQSSAWPTIRAILEQNPTLFAYEIIDGHAAKNATMTRGSWTTWREPRSRTSCGRCSPASQYLRPSAIARIQFVHEHVNKLRDVLWRPAMDDAEIVRRNGRALSNRSEQTDDDELNVARR